MHTKISIFSFLICLILSLFLFQSAVAGGESDPLAELKQQMQLLQQQMQQLQQRIEDQEKVIEKQAATIKTHTVKMGDQVVTEKRTPVRDIEEDHEESSDEPAIEVSYAGLVEVTAIHSSNDGWSDQGLSDINLASLELDLSISFEEWLSANIVFFYEDNDTAILPIDQAFLTFAYPNSPFFVNLGRTYVFADESSNMISYPSTFFLADTQEDIIEVGAELENGINGSIYAFSDDVNKDGKTNRLNYGLNLGLGNDDYTLGLSYIGNIGTSGTLQDLISQNANGSIEKNVAGLGIHAGLNMGQFSFFGEYISAMDSFAPNELTSLNNARLKPKAWNLEMAYNFELSGKEAYLALGYQGTKDMYFDTETTDFFEKAWLLAFSMQVLQNTSLSIEWRRAYAYEIVKRQLGNNVAAEDLLQFIVSYEF